MQNPQGSNQASGVIASAYAAAFLAASLVAVTGIACTSFLRAMDAWDDRKDRKKKAATRATGPLPVRPGPTVTKVVKPAAKPASTTKSTAPKAAPKPAPNKPAETPTVPLAAVPKDGGA